MIPHNDETSYLSADYFEPSQGQMPRSDTADIYNPQLALEGAAKLNEALYSAYENGAEAITGFVTEILSKYNYSSITVLRLLITLSLIAQITYASDHLFAQDEPDTEPPIGWRVNDETGEFEFFDNLDVLNLPLGELIVNKSVDYEIQSLDQLKEIIKHGVSSNTYNLYFLDEKTQLDVSGYLKTNPIILSTGKVSVSFNPSFITDVYPKDHNFIVQTDTQPMKPLHETSTTVKQTATNPITATETIIEILPEAVTKVTVIVTGTNNVTEKITFTGPWTTTIAKEPVYREGLSAGRSFMVSKPSFIIMNLDGTPKEEIAIYGMYTGGEFDVSTNIFNPSFALDPIYNLPSLPNFHGDIIAQFILGATINNPNLTHFGGDIRSINFGEPSIESLTYAIAAAVIRANQLDGGNRKVIATESNAGATDGLNKLFGALREDGLPYEDVFAFGSAGNSNDIVDFRVENSHIAQVIALTPELIALTEYTNYDNDLNSLLGGRGDFLAVTPVIENGKIVYKLRTYHGTSMATPLGAGLFADWVQNQPGITPTIESAFSEVKQVIAGADITGGFNNVTVAEFSLAELNYLLLSQNPMLTVDNYLHFNANWANLNQTIKKGDGILPIVNVPWRTLIKQPTVFGISPTIYDFLSYYNGPGFGDVLFTDSDGSDVIIVGIKDPAIADKIVDLYSRGLLPDIAGPSLTGTLLYQNLRIIRPESSKLPDLLTTWPGMFEENTLIIRKFDPSFDELPAIDTRKYYLYLPLINYET